jgi:dimethylargininase
MDFKKAIVRRPCKRMSEGLRSRNLGQPDYKNAVKQHDRYIKALEKCGVEVFTIEADENFPDSVFIEDTAVLTERVAIITNPGVSSRRGEESATYEKVKSFYKNIERIEHPGTLEGGDVLQIENCFYIGISERTNREGAQQLERILNRYEYETVFIDLKELLHLKTGCSYLGDNKVVVAYEIKYHQAFQRHERVEFNKKESYAANCLNINDNVLLPRGYPFARKKMENMGFKTIIVDVSEFRKLDGGLSCLSLRF